MKTDKRKELFEKLNAIIESNNTINQYTDDIPVIELDILMEKVRIYYQSVRELKKMKEKHHFNGTPDKPIALKWETMEVVPPLGFDGAIADAQKEAEIIAEYKEEAPEFQTIPEIDEEIYKIDVSEEEIIESIRQEISIEPEIKQEPIIIEEILNEPYIEEKQEPIIEKIVESQTLVSTNKEVPQKAKIQTGDLFSSSVTISEKLMNDKQSVYDKFNSGKEDQSIGTQMQKQQIKDIKAVIGINEKFKFVQNLFKGSLNEYNEAIKTLNDSEGLEQAINYLSELSVKYSWKEDSDAYEQFTDIVRRRFK